MLDYMPKEKEVPFIHFVARPKRGNSKIVDDKIWDVMGLFAEIFDEYQRDCSLLPLKKGSVWNVQMTFESDEARSLITDDPRFQEIITDLRVYCKPAYRIRHLFYPILHPGK
jgi:hypothetical protein